MFTGSELRSLLQWLQLRRWYIRPGYGACSDVGEKKEEVMQWFGYITVAYSATSVITVDWYVNHSVTGSTAKVIIESSISLDESNGMNAIVIVDSSVIINVSRETNLLIQGSAWRSSIPARQSGSNLNTPEVRGTRNSVWVDKRAYGEGSVLSGSLRWLI